MEELSFEELGKAFARVMRGESSEERPEKDVSAGEEYVDIPEEFLEDDAFEDTDAESRLSMFDEDAEEDSFSYSGNHPYATEIDDDGIVPVTPLSVLESLLFLGNPQNKPLPKQTASDLMRGVDVPEVERLVGELKERYDREHCPWTVISENDGYRMQLREEFAPIREVFYGKIREARLTQSAIDVLAIIAYQQPLTLEDISQVRGSNCSAILGQLVRRKLLRAQKVRRGGKLITEYYTTDRFLKLFELGSLDDLPQSENLDRE
ncbi:MAG: SMC-Scp complex subunit ScpB [Planctomycetia bacterium]|nr:SMC-Scp complex subunit ScpB [Planctomycetia bacterium]